MYEAYAKTSRAIPDLQSAEELLHNIVGGAFERYLPDASFGSGAYPNIVSACLIVMDSPDQARIAQLFTHPLYRARGLATTEIAFAMNRLSATGVKSLTAWSQEGDDVVKRLLTKMGFAETGRAVEVSAKV
jgi:predicted GNAT family acetyltransferase